MSIYGGSVLLKLRPLNLRLMPFGIPNIEGFGGINEYSVWSMRTFKYARTTDVYLVRNWPAGAKLRRLLLY